MVAVFCYLFMGVAGCVALQCEYFAVYYMIMRQTCMVMLAVSHDNANPLHMVSGVLEKCTRQVFIYCRALLCILQSQHI